MPKTVHITLGDAEYSIPRLNIGQIEELSDIYDDPAFTSNFKSTKAIAEILLRRASPKIEDFDEIECTPEELATAIRKVLTHSGLSQESKPGEAAAKG